MLAVGVHHAMSMLEKQKERNHEQVKFNRSGRIIQSLFKWMLCSSPKSTPTSRSWKHLAMTWDMYRYVYLHICNRHSHLFHFTNPPFSLAQTQGTALCGRCNNSCASAKGRGSFRFKRRRSRRWKSWSDPELGSIADRAGDPPRHPWKTMTLLGPMTWVVARCSGNNNRLKNRPSKINKHIYIYVYIYIYMYIYIYVYIYVYICIYTYDMFKQKRRLFGVKVILSYSSEEIVNDCLYPFTSHWSRFTGSWRSYPLVFSGLQTCDGGATKNGRTTRHGIDWKSLNKNKWSTALRIVTICYNGYVPKP